MTFVGVCGGRKYWNVERVADVLSKNVMPGSDTIVHGGANGADTLAGDWSVKNGAHQVIVPANWEAFGKSAGMRRNAVIAALPLRLLIAFPGGVGTAGMMKLARAKGIPVIEVTP